MSTQQDVVEIRQSIVAHAQTVMRAIEMVDVSRYHDLSWARQFTLRMVQAHYSNRMLALLALMPVDVTTEVLAASEKTAGWVSGFTQN